MGHAEQIAAMPPTSDRNASASPSRALATTCPESC
jgi:hypothetical protein